MKNKKLHLLTLLLILVTTKFITIMMNKGAYIFSDEACAINVANYFANNLAIANCSDIIKITANDHLPLFPVLISPILKVFPRTFSYQAIIAFQILLSSSLIFPLQKIINHYLPKLEKLPTTIIIAAILFSPLVTTYENTALTEISFLFFNVWGFSFYIEKTKKQLISYIFFGLATITRPFGFIVLLAAILTEAIKAKSKKNIATIYLPLGIIFSFFLLSLSVENIQNFADKFFLMFKNENSSLNIIKAIFAQLNSILIGIGIIPTFIAIKSVISKKKYSQEELFLIIFIILNLIIGIHHSISYYSQGKDPGMITRYLNVSLFIILGTTIIQICKSTKLNKKDLGIIALFTVPLIFTPVLNKHALNLDISYLLDSSHNLTSTELLKSNLLNISPYTVLIITGTYIYWLLIVKSKKTITKTFFILVLSLALSASNFIWTQKSINSESEVFKYFKYKSEEIIFLDQIEKQIANNSDFWKLITETENTTHYSLIGNYEKFKDDQEAINNQISELAKSYNYLITPLSFELEAIQENNGVTIYKLK